MITSFAQTILSFPARFPMPIGVYAGLEMTHSSIYQAVTDAQIQADAVLALHQRFDTPAMLTAMDLSAEAEAFGCTIRMPEDEIPTVLGRLVTTADEINALPAPQPGDRRTAVHLETARRLVAQSMGTPVLGGMIGPFSLAGRLFGVSEAMELTVNDPEMMKALLEKSTQFLIAYARAFRETGASGIIIAEPAAGLLSPRSLKVFSSPYVKQIVEAVQTAHFGIVLHNCGAKLAHLPCILESGAEMFHFGAPMDITAALQQVAGKEVILGGNLDPTAVFHNGTPATVAQKTADLLEATRDYSHFFMSSGCDLPPGTPIANLDAFYQTIREPVKI